MATGSGRGAASISDDPQSLRKPYAFVAALAVAWLVRLALVPVSDMASADVASARIVAELWRGAIWLGLPLVWLRVVERADPRAAIDLRPGAAPKYAWPAVAALTLASRGIEVLAGGAWIAIPPVPVASFAVAATSLLFAALCEEFVFRGLVLKALAGRHGFWKANAIAALLYGAILAPGWFVLADFGAGTFAYLFVSVVLYAVLLGGLVRLSGTVWPAVAAHFLNDLLQGFGFPG
ncbi:MAG: CPBP family intramembrane metalloprotease [Alphaproteobacteria bacterium]|nr:CPBP family intramembrane metalloprotease [Alphaproteobacteria bacterium]